MNEEKIKSGGIKTAVVILSALCVILFIALLAMLILYAYGKLSLPTSVTPSEESSNAENETQTDGMAVKISELEFERDELQKNIDEKESKITSLEAELNTLKEQNTSTDEAAVLRENDYKRQIQELEGEIKKKQDEINAVNDRIAAYKSITSLNIGSQAQKVSELFELLGGGAPMRVLYKDTAETDGEGRLLKDEKGKTVQVSYKQYPHVAFYYEDVTTGYTIEYNSTDAFFAASIIKTPYIYSVLREISEFEQKKYDFTPSAEGESNPNLDEFGNIIYLDGEEKYDLSRKWTFVRETMDKEGTGKIKDMENGVTMTYEDLFRYAVEYSDNIAFAQLRETFGYDSYYKYAAELKTGSYGGFMQVSAQGMGRFNRAMYDFIENDTKYGAFLKELMLNANYKLLIPYAVSPKTVAHKYGWDIDSYHDTAIVYDEHPYILVIMTDMDTVSENENNFIRRVASLIDDIHEGYYNGIDKSLSERYEELIEKMAETEQVE